MTEPKWTPGPWRHELVSGSYQRPALVMAGDKVIAACLGNQLDPAATSIGEATANARLIAAAPDIAEAGESLCDAVDQMQIANATGDHDLFMNWAGVVLTRRTVLRAALAKARGETP